MEKGALNGRVESGGNDERIDSKVNFGTHKQRLVCRVTRVPV